jgi:hypothetical protein
MKEIDIRETYDEEIREEREAVFSARQSISNDFKKWPTDLWMKVIQRAIEDAAFAKSLRDSGEELTDEVLDWEDSAIEFLFNDNHKIPFDDYVVEISCPRCGFEWSNQMSVVAAETSICSKCKYKINTKYIEYRIKKEQILKEISLEELVSLWGVNDIDRFREGCRKRIDELSKKKKPKGLNWRSNKC